MGAFFKVVMNGSYAGKDNKNILWYRAAFDPLDGAFGFGGAENLANQIVQELVPAFLDVHPSTYTLDTIDVYPHNEMLQLLYQLPYRAGVNLPGTVSMTDVKMDSSALVANFRFNLEPTLIGGQSLTAPKRGYVAVGPVLSAWVDDTGRLIDGLFDGVEAKYAQLGNVLSSDLESVLPPALFFPVRVSQKWGVGGSGAGLLSWGWADIQGGTWDRYVSFRRSRRIKG